MPQFPIEKMRQQKRLRAKGLEETRVIAKALRKAKAKLAAFYFKSGSSKIDNGGPESSPKKTIHKKGEKKGRTESGLQKQCIANCSV